MVGFRFGAATDVGAQRTANQDSYATADGLAVVADGMGGHRGGEVASSLAAHHVVEQFGRRDLAVLVTAVEQSNKRILDAAALNPRLHGMGTTVVALALIDVPSGVSLGAVNVGDSRMYRLTGNVLEQLTEDHSLVEALVREGRLTPAEAEVHPQRNIVTRALGVIEDVDVDSFHFIPKVGDRYLLCSDGLFNEVTAHEIATILATYADPQETADALIVAANIGGGRDNITTVVVDIVAEESTELPAVPRALASPEVLGDPTAIGDHDPINEPDPTDDSHGGGNPAPLDVPNPPAGDKNRWTWRR